MPAWRRLVGGAKVGPRARPGIERGEAGGAFKKGFDLLIVLLRQERASHIGQRAARFDKRRRRREQRALLRLPFQELHRGQPPFRIRPPPPDAGPAARRVDEHDIHPAIEPGQRIGIPRRQRLHVPGARPLQPLENRPEPDRVGVVGVDLPRVLHLRGQCERLAASARANIRHLQARPRPASSAAIWLPSS